MKCLTVFLFCFSIPIILSESINDAEFEFVKLVHRLFCGPQSLCNSSNEIAAGSNNDSSAITLNNLPIKVPERLPEKCCKPCSCNISTCVDYGNCCPVLLDHLPTVEESLEPTKAECRNTSLRTLIFNGEYWVFRFCAKEYVPGNNLTAVDIKSRCENTKDYFDEVITHQPVIDPVTQRTFANHFCALCNFVEEESDLIPWNLRLVCYEEDTFKQKTKYEKLIQDVLNTTWCDLEFEWPYKKVDFFAPACKSLVRQCNVTGLWKQYDPVIEAACHAYRAEYDFKYNNIFCFQCNELENNEMCSDLGQREIGTVSFSAVLDFGREIAPPITEPSSLCTAEQVYDHYKGVCRDLACIFPRLYEGDHCVSIADKVTEVAYRLQVKFQPAGIYEDSAIDTMVPMIMTYTDTLLETWNSQGAAFSYAFFYKFGFEEIDPAEEITPHDVTTQLPLPTTLKDHIPVSSTASTTASNTFEKKPRAKRQEKDTTTRKEKVTPPGNLVPNVGAPLPNEEGDPGETRRAILAVKYILWQVQFYFKYFVSGEHSADFIDNILLIDQTNVTLTGSNGLSVTFSLVITDYGASQFTYPKDPVDNTYLSIYPLAVSLPNADRLFPINSPIQTVKQTLVCPLLDIGSDEFNITETARGVFIKELNTTIDTTLYEKKTVDQTMSVYSICKDAYVTLTDRYIKNQTTQLPAASEITPQGVLSVVCACVSILCSFLTLITYLLFAELRTQPGINNIFVCVYLICAQVFFTFATPQADSVSDSMCALIGALVHFFWLMVVFAMNVCCYHMVMVFIGQSANRTKTSSTLRKSVLYTIYCILSSLVFVSINIIVVVVDTNNAQNGYGDGICYISRPEMVGYVFALPLGVILLINLVLFVTVIIKISRSPNVNSSNKKNRNYFKIYAKLSSVTGLTWIFGFLFEFTDVVVFEYLFIILNGGIGVLIFLSFVCNKRIYNLYKEKIFKTVSKTDTGKTFGQSSKTGATELSSVSMSSNTDT